MIIVSNCLIIHDALFFCKCVQERGKSSISVILFCFVLFHVLLENFCNYFHFPQVVKKSLVTFVNKHLNKINLEVTELESQFSDGVST